MPSRQLSLTDSAIDDLRLIRNYSAQNWGMDQAVGYTDSLLESMELLISNPELGRRVSPDRPGLRRIVSHQHIIYYRVLEERIEIVRVIHGSAAQLLDFD